MNKDILFILGSGTSVDSGLFTYRGINRKITEEITNKTSLSEVWNYFENFHQICSNVELGETYHLIDQVIDLFPNSDILTQNIDRLIFKLKNKNPIIELHGNCFEMKCSNCGTIENINFNKKKCDCEYDFKPNVTLLGDFLDKNVNIECHKIKKIKYKYILIIGTTLQFPYLRQIIGKIKQRGVEVIHINPDKNYNDIPRPFNGQSISHGKYLSLKKKCNVRKKEIWINKNAAEGLKEFIQMVKSESINN